MDDLQSTVRKLREIVPLLNAATDRTCQVMQLAESLLGKELSIGLEAEVLVGRTDPVRISLPDERLHLYEQRTTWLSYRRLDGAFRFVVVTRTSRGNVDGLGGVSDATLQSEQEVAWTSAPRLVRLSAFKELPRLLSSLLLCAVKEIAEVEIVRRVAVETLDAIGASAQTKEGVGTPSRTVAPLIVQPKPFTIEKTPPQTIVLKTSEHCRVSTQMGPFIIK